MHWIIRFQGVPEAVGAARRMIRNALGDDHPKVDDVELIVSELATNSVLHSRSGQGGYFWVEINQRGDRLRLEVFDSGRLGMSNPHRGDEASDYGRGLQIIAALADAWGHDYVDGHAQSVWAELASPAASLSRAHAQTSTSRGV